MTYYAHTRGNAKSDWQTVLQHLTGTAALAREIGADSGLADFAALAARFHDLGKYSLAFQRRLEGGPKTDHATAGAKELERLLAARGQAVFGRMLAYCIAGHHGGLPDGGSPVDTEEEASLAGRLKRTLNDYSAYASELPQDELVAPLRFPKDFRPAPEASGFSISFATRMIYSILVDADFLETETFCNGGQKARGGYQSIDALSEQFDRYLQRFATPRHEIDRRRSAALQACIQQSSLPRGAFTLTLPTGAGKTLTSMAFALRHAQAHGLRRIIYVIPYTSIIEQNAAVFREAFGPLGDHVLEHHASIEWDRKQETDAAGPDSARQKLKWAAENWDVPVIVTTNVQFFESLFANRSSRSRKVHNLAKSVIIFDEAQMLPREFLKPCLAAVAELVRNYGASAVFCTATQPALEQFLPTDIKPRELIADPQGEFDAYRRVQVRLAGRLTDEALLERLNSHAQALCIVNTRKHARALFAGLQGEGCYHLSTLMCPQHRRAKLAEIRQRLAGGLPCRVVSTQLLEAGVDLDFPVGYRALAGLDSIIQSAGRVNREGKLVAAEMFVFEPDSEHARRMPGYIKQTAAVADLVLKDFPNDPASVEAIAAYYKELYHYIDPNTFDQECILKLLTPDANPPSIAYASAAEKFRLIEEDTLPVIVPLDETARGLLAELETAPNPLGLMRKLQPYTVSIYRPEFQALAGSGAIQSYNEAYGVLRDPESSYDEHTGLVLADRGGGLGVFCSF